MRPVPSLLFSLCFSLDITFCRIIIEADYSSCLQALKHRRLYDEKHCRNTHKYPEG